MIVGFTGDPAAFAALAADLSAHVFSEVARADRRGQHLIIVPRSIASWAVDSLDLSERDAAQITRIAQRYPQSGQFLSADVPKVIVDPQSTHWTFTDQDIVVPPDLLVQTDLLQPVALIVEDLLSDGEFYKWLFPTFAKRRRNLPPVKLEILHGGGGGIRRVVKSKIRARDRLYVAIVDSDKDTPICTEKRENNLLRKLCLGSDGQVRISETPCREMENILPLHLIESVTGINSDTYLDRLRTAIRHNLIECTVLSYFDFKRGIDVDEFLDKHAAHPDKVAWLQGALRISRCPDSGIVIGGFGSSVADNFNDSNAEKADLFSYFGGDNWWNDIFLEWIEGIVILLASSGEPSRT